MHINSNIDWPNVIAVSPEDAAKFGDIILLAIPWRKKHELPPATSFKIKIVIDAMNPYSENREVMNLGKNRNLTEVVAKEMPEARIVKAFSTMNYQNLDAKGYTKHPKSDRLVIFVAGDDIETKAIVSNLIEEIGFTAVDSGSLRSGGYKQQPGSSIYNVPVTLDQAKKLLTVATEQ